MRTGAIFARGSCRALAWVLALGVAAVLSGGEAVAQTATVIVPDKLVLTPTSVDVDEGAGETFTVQLMTKELASDETAPTTAEVTVTLARAGATDDAHFLVGGVDTEALTAGAQVGTLSWTFTLGTVAGLVDPGDNKFVHGSSPEKTPASTTD